MFDYYNSTRSERQLKSLTGLGKKQFEELLLAFSESLTEISDEAYRKNRTKRSRRPGGGRKGQLLSTKNKLFFILFYLKNYPTFDVLGFIFDLNPSNAEENVKKLLPVLERAQSKLNVLPFRSIKSDSELEEALEKVAKPSDITEKETKNQTIEHQANLPQTTVSSIVSSIENTSESTTVASTDTDELLAFIDVTERSHFRPKNNRLQKKYYSGKKKRHTVKNTLISDNKRRVIFLGRTFKGSLHDDKIFKKELPPSRLDFSEVKIAVDLGYQGIKKDYSSARQISIPNKKPRKSKENPNPSLTRKQKAQNKKMASKRVVVEHAIGGMKAFQILSAKFRNNMTKNWVDEVIFQVAGLWNLKIRC